MENPPKRKSEGRTSLSEIAGQFVHRDGDRAFCRIEGVDSQCTYIQSKYDAGNFIRHFRTQHTNLASQHGLMTEQSTTLAKRPRSIPKVSVPVDKQLLVDSAIKLVAYHHLPLTCFEWEGLRQIFDPLGTAVGITMNRPNAKTHIQQAVSALVPTMAAEMKNRLLCLMIDSATRLNHHVLGIGVQFVVGSKIVTRTLGMIEIKDRQTADFLKGKVLEILARYNIKLEQIFSITVDNGANMLACVKRLKDELESSIASLLPESEDTEVFTTTIADEVADKLSNEFHDQARENLNMIRCAVHTLQLAILDVVNKSNAMVKQVTEIAKRCKHIKYKTSFDYHQATYPPVWCQTRWGGIYKMLESFLEQKSFFTQLGQEFPDLDLSSSWEFIQQYVEAFKPCYICTKKLQEAHVSLSDFYMEWLMTICSVRKLENNPFTRDLTDTLTNRLTNLRCSMAFKMALFIDPRFNYSQSKIFTTEEKEQVQRFIIHTWNRIKQLDDNYSDEPTSASSSISGSNEKDDFITEMFGGSLLGSNTSSATFQQQLKALEAEQRQSTTYNVWEHWMNRKATHPELSAVASVVLAVPATQSTVQRAFSALGLVLSPHRSTLGEDTLENILLIKLNKEVYEQISGTMYNWKEKLTEN